MKTVTLSDGTKVNLKDKYTHKMAKVFASVAYKSIVYQPDDANPDKMTVTRSIPKNDLDDAYEAIIALMVDSIDKQGVAVPFSQIWLDDLPPKDYDALEAAAIEIKCGTGDDGEKKGRRSS